MCGAHEFEVAPVVRDQRLHGIDLRARGREKDGLRRHVAGHGEPRGVVTVPLRRRKRLALLDLPLRAAEQVEIEADTRAHRVHVTGVPTEGAAALSPGRRTKVHLRFQCAPRCDSGFVGLRDGRVGGVEIEVAGDRATHDMRPASSIRRWTTSRRRSYGSRRHAAYQRHRQRRRGRAPPARRSASTREPTDARSRGRPCTRPAGWV